MLEPSSKEAPTKSYKRTKRTSKKIKAATWANQKAPRGSASPQQRVAKHGTAAPATEMLTRGGLLRRRAWGADASRGEKTLMPLLCDKIGRRPFVAAEGKIGISGRFSDATAFSKKLIALNCVRPGFLPQKLYNSGTLLLKPFG